DGRRLLVDEDGHQGSAVSGQRVRRRMDRLPRRRAAETRRQVFVTLFVSSFLVLFLEIALIRWMPAYVRLLGYFSNFILLATFLGGGLGCLLANRRRSLITWFPLLQLIVILAVDRLRLEVAVPASA